MAKVVSPAEQGDMVYLGEFYGYQLYRNSEGFIEGYKSIDLINTDGYCRPAKDLKRVVTNTKEINEFPKFIKKHAGKKSLLIDGVQTKLDIL